MMVVLAAWIVQRTGSTDDRVASSPPVAPVEPAREAPPTAPPAVPDTPPPAAITQTLPAPPAIETRPPAATESVPPTVIERMPPAATEPVPPARVTDGGRAARSRNEAFGSRVAARPRATREARRSTSAPAPARARAEVTRDAQQTDVSRPAREVP